VLTITTQSKEGHGCARSPIQPGKGVAIFQNKKPIRNPFLRAAGASQFILPFPLICFDRNKVETLTMASSDEEYMPDFQEEEGLEEEDEYEQELQDVGVAKELDEEDYLRGALTGVMRPLACLGKA
jgi:hypothetical protein